eukprot:COSAG01_NODE_24_length_37608_cov_19.303154_13_plen_91_part_00
MLTEIYRCRACSYQAIQDANAPGQVMPGSWADTQPGVAPGLVISQLQGEAFGCDSYARVVAALRRHEMPRAEAQSLVVVWGQTAVLMQII